MNLITNSVPAATQKSGTQDNIIVPAGKTLKIETTPDGEEVLNVVVPAGKRWVVAIGVDIREEDV